MEQLRAPVGRLISPIVAGLVRLGVTADAITIAGCLGSCVVGAIVATGQLSVGGLVFLLVSALDMFDGAVARATGTVRPFGAFLDSVLDRIAEAAVFAGLVYYFGARGQGWEALVTVLALIGSFGVSYARARAEGLGYDCNVGLLQRPERVVLLGAGLLLHDLLLLPVLVILVLLTAVTVWQRVAHTARVMGERERQSDSPG